MIDDSLPAALLAEYQHDPSRGRVHRLSDTVRGSKRITLDAPAVNFINGLGIHAQNALINAIHEIPGRENINPMPGYKDLYTLRVGAYCVLLFTDADGVFVLNAGQTAEG